MKKSFRNVISLFITAVMIITAAVIPASAANEISLPKNEAITFVNSMGAGWNLGNSFDSHNCTWLTNKLDYESGWCGVKASKALIKTVKDAGFGTIRIPVTWYDHVDSDFNIDTAWMNRVAEVTDWCLAEDLYVIIDVHHDVLHNWYYPSSSELESSTAYLKKVWEQIAEKFKDYSNKVIFEPINEPRLKDTDYEWWYDRYNIPSAVQDSIECINKLNQTALNAIRASGGNNATRFVLVGGYDTDGTWKGALSTYFRLPQDTVSNRLIVDAHIYGTDKLGELDGLYNSFVTQGIPVVISEYGLDSGGYDYIGQESTAAQIMSDFGSYARERGISVVVWDNNSGSKGQAGHKFIDRATASVVTPIIISQFTKSNAASVSAGVDSISAIADQTYTGSEIKPEITVLSGNTVLKAGTDYTVGYSNNINVGTATVTVTGIGNYSGSASAEFRIIPADAEGLTIEAIADQTYTGSEIKPEITVLSGNAVLKAGTDYTVGYSNNINAGTATITVTGIGNYTGTKTVSFVIKAAPVTPPAVTAAAGDSCVTLTWEAVDGATRYYVSRVNDDGTYTTINKALKDTKITVSGLTNGTEYTFLVQAYVNGKWSSSKSRYYVKATPKASAVPPAVTASAGNASVTLTWEAVDGATKYYVSRVNDDGTYTTINKALKDTKITVSGLTNGTEYTFLVQAYVNGKWSSSKSRYYVKVTPKASAVPPAVTASAGNASVTLTWEAVDGATKYYVSFVNDDGTYTTINKALKDTKITVSDLTNGTEYTFLVQSYVNGKWSSSKSRYYVKATPKASAVPPAVTASAGNASVTLTWEAVDGATKYYVSFVNDDGTYTTINKALKDTKITVSDLTNGTEYTFLVQSYVNGKWSSSKSRYYVKATPVS